MKPVYTVRVLGFNTTEQIVLGSIFGMSARREPRYVRLDTEETEPDLHLVDADDPIAMGELRIAAAHGPVTAVLIGSTDHDTGLPRLPRPLQWARLFATFDRVMGHAPDAHGAPHAAAGGHNVPGHVTALPAAAHASRSAPAPAPAHAAASDGSAPEVRHSERILVIDADPNVREFMRNRLAPFHIPADLAASGEEALALATTRAYTCAFVGATLPGIDGIQVARILKTRKGGRPLAVVLMTSTNSTVEKLKGKLAGCDALLAKPLDDDELLAVVARYVAAPAAA